MINGFIATIIALFFWKRGTKETEEKTQHASCLRTVTYFVLSVLIGVFFYKTYQVSTIYNAISVYPIRASFNSDGVLTDTISSIEIFNRFTSQKIYNNALYEKGSKIGSRADYVDRGGVKLKLRTHVDSSFIIKDNPTVPAAAVLQDMNVPIEKPNQVYIVGFINTVVPNLIPVFPKFNQSFGWSQVSKDLFAKMQIEDTKSNDDLFFRPSSDKTEWYEDSEKDMDFMMDGIFFKEYFVIGEVDDISGDFYELTASSSSNVSNTLGFFTAADISQYTHMISINGDCHVSTLYMDYDVPIEIQNMDSCMTIGTTGFHIKGDMLEAMKNSALMYHVKLPTMANLQLIRSLILTTLITALISLFFSNLYYLIRKWAKKYKRDHFLPYSKAKLISRKRIKRFKLYIYIIIFALLAFILWISYLICNDILIYFPIEIADNLDYIIYGFVVLISIIILLLYYHATRPIQAEKTSQDEDVIPSIFVHDKDEDEEYDKMVEEMYNNGSDEKLVVSEDNDDQFEEDVSEKE